MRRGDPTGLLKDNAMGLVDRVVPDPSDAMRDRALAAAMKYVAEQGVTSVHNMGTWAELATFARARRANALGTRVYAAVPLADWAAPARRRGQQGVRRRGWPRRPVAARRRR